MTEDTFKLADEVRAENRGDVWDPVNEVAIPAEPVDVPVEVPADPSDTEPKVEEQVNQDQ